MLYIGDHAFFRFAKPGDLLITHKGNWYSCVLSKNLTLEYRERILEGPNILTWKPQKRPLPKLAAAFKAIYLNQ